MAGVRQYETDIAIIGAGGAGVAAGIEAREAGARAIAFEQGSELGGAAIISGGGCLIVGSPLQKANGIHDTPDLAFKDWIAWGGPSADAVWARYYIEHTLHDLYHWAEGLGVTWVDLKVQEGNSVLRWTRPDRNGLGLMTHLIEGLRKNIRDLDDRIVKLREKQLVAPKDGMLPGYVTDTVDSLGKDIDEARKRIELNRAEIAKTKREVHEALRKAGVELSPEQVDLLLDSVLSGDLVRLVAVFNSAKLIDAQLGKLLSASGESIGAARKYFAMHAALFALLVQAQDLVIAKIDNQYLPKLTAIETDIRNARAKTAELMKLENRDDQKRALESNRDSQRLAEEAARGYRRYLLQQREQVAKARQRSTHDLRIADNTFETVEASFQLRNLMRDATASFEAIQKLEAPTFDQIFKNEELRREFESLTRKLDAPTS